jgi:hypothetical protein
MIAVCLKLSRSHPSRSIVDGPIEIRNCLQSLTNTPATRRKRRAGPAPTAGWESPSLVARPLSIVSFGVSLNTLSMINRARIHSPCRRSSYHTHDLSHVFAYSGLCSRHERPAQSHLCCLSSGRSGKLLGFFRSYADDGEWLGTCSIQMHL